MANDTNFVPVRAHLRRTGASGGNDIQQEHGPDTQAMPEGDDGADMLPMGDSTQGMFGNVSDDASGSDIERGFSTIGNDTVNAPPGMPRDGYDDSAPHEEREGFAGRPGGWER